VDDHVVVQRRDGPASRAFEESGHKSMNETGASGPEKPEGEAERRPLMPEIALADRVGMIQKPAPKHYSRILEGTA
jgi:hypothetical protein